MLLARTVGAEGLGLFQLALPIYLVVLTLASLGLPLATTQLVAAAAARGDLAAAAGVRRRTALLGGATAALGTVALLALAAPVSRHWLGDPRAAAPLAVLAWALPFAVLEAIYRGYWQGLHRMARVGVAQVGENVVRLLLLLLWTALLPRPTPLGGAVAAAALLVGGEATELLAVTLRARADPAVRPPGPPGVPLGRILSLSLPVAVSRVAGTLGLALDATLIPAGLRAGGADALAATAAFGRFTGMVMPLVTFPTVVMGPLGAALVPAVAEAAARGARARLARQAAVAAAAAAALGAITTGGLLLGPAQVGRALYGQADLGPLLAAGALAAPGLFLAMAATSVLNGLGRTGAALLAQLTGGGVRLALILLLVPRAGIAGAALATAAGMACSALLAWALVAELVRRL